jgi:hypothetical protein
MKKSSERAKNLSHVNCAYLIPSTGVISSGDRVIVTPPMIECVNNQCGPMPGCDYLEKGHCDYRSSTMNPDHLYDPDGFQKYLRERDKE